MSLAFLGLGSNLGNSFEMLQNALSAINAEVDIQVVDAAPVYVSDPMGGIATGPFLNTVISINTSLLPEELLRRVKNIEIALGRKPRARWDSREIDIDLLLYDDLILKTPILKLPHPGVLSRDFVLLPLSDIATGLVHPVTLEKISVISIPDSGKFVSGTYPEKLVIK